MTNSSMTNERQPSPLFAEAAVASQTGIIASAHAGLASSAAGAKRAQVGSLLLPAKASLAAARRLVVLVPNADVDEASLAASLWALASPRALEVLLLGTLQQPEEQYKARRRLITLAAITRDGAVHVSFELLPEWGWEQALRHVWRPGDLIVCPGELKVTAGLRYRPLAQTLLRKLAAPVYVIAGFYPALPDEKAWGLAQLAGLLPLAAILAVFFAMQVRLVQATSGSLQTVLLSLSVVVEFLLVAAWQRFLNTLP